MSLLLSVKNSVDTSIIPCRDPKCKENPSPSQDFLCIGSDCRGALAPHLSTFAVRPSAFGPHLWAIAFAPQLAFAPHCATGPAGQGPVLPVVPIARIVSLAWFPPIVRVVGIVTRGPAGCESR